MSGFVGRSLAAVFVIVAITLSACAVTPAAPEAPVAPAAPVPSVGTMADPESFDGVGAVAEPADLDLRPTVSSTTALSALHHDQFAQTLIAKRTPSQLLLVNYTNRFGTQTAGGEKPSVPRQLAWLAVYEHVRVVGGSRPAGRYQSASIPEWDCTYYVALSAQSARIIDGFDICQ